MADKPAIRQRAIRRLAEKLLTSVSWSDVVAAFQAASTEDRAAYAAAIYGASASELRRRTDAVVRPYIIAQATTAVDAALADDSLTLDELETILL